MTYAANFSVEHKRKLLNEVKYNEGDFLFFCWIAFIYFLYCPIFRSLLLSVLFRLSYMNNEALLHFQIFVFWFLKGLNPFVYFFF